MNSFLKKECTGVVFIVSNVSISGAYLVFKQLVFKHSTNMISCNTSAYSNQKMTSTRKTLMKKYHRSWRVIGNSISRNRANIKNSRWYVINFGLKIVNEKETFQISDSSLSILEAFFFSLINTSYKQGGYKNSTGFELLMRLEELYNRASVKSSFKVVPFFGKTFPNNFVPTKNIQGNLIKGFQE